MPQDKTITKVSPPFQDKLLNPETGYMSRPWELYFLRLPLTLSGQEGSINSFSTRMETAESAALTALGRDLSGEKLWETMLWQRVFGG